MILVVSKTYKALTKSFSSNGYITFSFTLGEFPFMYRQKRQKNLFLQRQVVENTPQTAPIQVQTG